MLLLSIVFLPLLGSIASGLFGFYIGRKGSVFITTLTTFLSFIFSLIIFYDSITSEYEYLIYLATWINSGLFNCNWIFLFDTLTMVMLVVVTSISTLVHLYSSQYMAHDPHLSRFMSYLSLFTFFMFFLVLSGNLLLFFFALGRCWYNFLFVNRFLVNKNSGKYFCSKSFIC